MDLAKRFHSIGDRSELRSMMINEQKNNRNMNESIFSATEAALKERLSIKASPPKKLQLR